MKQLTAALLILLAFASAAATAAPNWHRYDGLQQVAKKSSGISLDQAAEQVRKQTGGRILSAETVTRNGRTVHRIKVLTPKHRVIIREINANGR